MSDAGAPLGAKAPLGGSDPHEVGKRGGAHFVDAGPPQGAKAPLGGSDPHEVGKRGGAHYFDATSAKSVGVIDIDALPHVMGDDGQFHAQDDAVDLSDTPAEAWVALGFFWMLGATVFYQFFTRYVMNNSAAWTEEIARYLLIATVFTGAIIGVIKNNHIQVDFFYRFMPPRLSHVLATAIDLLRIAFFAAASVLTVLMMLKLGSTARMTMVDLPMNWVYGVCLLAFVAMTFRAAQVALIHRKRGWTVLERPMTTMDEK